MANSGNVLTAGLSSSETPGYNQKEEQNKNPDKSKFTTPPEFWGKGQIAESTTFSGGKFRNEDPSCYKQPSGNQNFKEGRPQGKNVDDNSYDSRVPNIWEGTQLPEEGKRDSKCIACKQFEDHCICLKRSRVLKQFLTGNPICPSHEIPASHCALCFASIIKTIWAKTDASTKGVHGFPLPRCSPPRYGCPSENNFGVLSQKEQWKFPTSGMQTDNVMHQAYPEIGAENKTDYHDPSDFKFPHNQFLIDKANFQSMSPPVKRNCDPFFSETNSDILKKGEAPLMQSDQRDFKGNYSYKDITEKDITDPSYFRHPSNYGYWNNIYSSDGQKLMTNISYNDIPPRENLVHDSVLNECKSYQPPYEPIIGSNDWRKTQGTFRMDDDIHRNLGSNFPFLPKKEYNSKSFGNEDFPNLESVSEVPEWRPNQAYPRDSYNGNQYFFEDDPYVDCYERYLPSTPHYDEDTGAGFLRIDVNMPCKQIEEKRNVSVGQGNTWYILFVCLLIAVIIYLLCTMNDKKIYFVNELEILKAWRNSKRESKNSYNNN